MSVPETNADGLISIGFSHQSITNGSQNPFCSSLKQLALNVDTAGPSAFAHPVFSDCGELIERIEASDLTDSTLEEYQNPFSNLPHLEKLLISNLNVSRLTKEFFSGLPELEYLEVVGDAQKIDPDAFTGMPSLKFLRLMYITLEESHLESLKNLPNLEDLMIQQTNISNVNSIKGLPKLKNLILTGDSISKFNITELKENLPNLRRVDLLANPLDPEFVKELEKDEIFQIKFRLIPVYY